MGSGNQVLPGAAIGPRRSACGRLAGHTRPGGGRVLLLDCLAARSMAAAAVPAAGLSGRPGCDTQARVGSQSGLRGGRRKPGSLVAVVTRFEPGACPALRAQSPLVSGCALSIKEGSNLPLKSRLPAGDLVPCQRWKQSLTTR